MIPILSGYIAYSLAGKPGIAPGMILGYVANNPIGESEVKTGFLGAMILGLATGYLVRWCKTWKVSNTIKTIMPILIVPIFTTFILGIIYIYVISVPIGACMDWLVKFLSGMQGGNAVLLGAITVSYTHLSVIQQAMVFILIIFLACFIKLRGYIKESDSYVLALLITNITCPWTLLAGTVRFD